MATGCSDDTPPNDPRCEDPAYRAAHPDECRLHPILVLKPEYSLKSVGQTVEYKLFLKANGAEVEIDSGITWDVSNPGAAMINENGVATAVASGQTSVSAEWQGMSAQAQMDVVGDCAEVNLNFRILIDNSKSMGQSFSSSFATKLSFAKSKARDFCDQIDFSHGQVSVSKFAGSATELQAWTTDPELAKTAISAIASTTEKTDLANALEHCVDGFEGQTGARIIVLFTDGEWTGDDPKPIAQAFRESGGILCIVAVRAWGTYFADLFEMASGGFLLSAYGAVEDTITSQLSGLKNFMCGGACSPDPGTAPTAQLNYTGWINWDASRVIRDSSGAQIDEIFPDDPGQEVDDNGRPAGYPDLIGLDKWDVRPGNGLYVDLQGTGAPGYANPGQDFGHGRLTSKDDFTFTSGENYKLTISVGGTNVKSNPGTWKVRIRAGNELDQLVTVSNGIEDFTVHEFPWTPGSTHTGKIIIEQYETPAGAHHNVGSAIDEVTLANLTTPATLLYDNFDDENPQTIPPNPGNYGGCVTIEEQTADPTPPTPRVVE